MSINRTIVAILAADVAGFSRLVSEDEEGTLSRLAEYSAVFRDCVERLQGRVFNTAGDAILAEFPSAVVALRAALEVQAELGTRNRELPPDRRLEFRMGITIGDVVQQEGDMLGDAVNIASRLEGLAQPGGICVSRSVHEAVGTKVDARFVSMGRQRLKNIPQPVPVFRVLPNAGAGSPPARSPWRRRAAAALGILLLCAIGGLVAFLDPTFAWTKARQPVARLATEEETAARTALTVSVAQPQRACFQDVARVGGFVVPREETEVRPDGDGLQITRVLVEPLDEVAAGDVLAQLAPPEGRGTTPVLVRSPVAGVVGKSTAVVGGTAATRAPPLFNIIHRGEMELAADAPIPMLDQLREGQVVKVSTLDSTDVVGRVRATAKVANYGTQLGSVRVSLGRNARLRWGVFARGVVTLGERCGLSVPFSSLLRGPDGAVVYIVVNRSVEARPVTTGLTSETGVEIRDGLSGTEQVVQRAGSFVREGDIVRTVVGKAGG